jgi:hypothetical protein
MPTAAKEPAHVARQRPYVGALAAARLEHRRVRRRCLRELKPVYLHRAGLELNKLTSASEIIGTFPLNLDR